MLALTIRQPYASAIFFGPNPKDVENRTWPPPSTLVGQHLAIHAAKSIEQDRVAEVSQKCGVEHLPMATGHIIGVVVVRGVVTVSDSRWFTGPVGWMLCNPIRVSPILRCSGQVGLWEVSSGHAKDIQAELAHLWYRSPGDDCERCYHCSMVRDTPESRVRTDALRSSFSQRPPG